MLGQQKHFFSGQANKAIATEHEKYLLKLPDIIYQSEWKERSTTSVFPNLKF